MPRGAAFAWLFLHYFAPGHGGHFKLMACGSGASGGRLLMASALFWGPPLQQGQQQRQGGSPLAAPGATGRAEVVNYCPTLAYAPGRDNKNLTLLKRFVFYPNCIPALVRLLRVFVAAAPMSRSICSLLLPYSYIPILLRHVQFYFALLSHHRSSQGAGSYLSMFPPLSLMCLLRTNYMVETCSVVLGRIF